MGDLDRSKWIPFYLPHYSKQSPDYPMQLMLNIYEISRPESGDKPAPVYPSEFRVDYVRFYQKDRNLDILDEREKEVFVGRFRLDIGGEERRQRVIAKDLGISRSCVSRIEKRALMKLFSEKNDKNQG